MAFDVKGAFVQALLELCERKELSKITINDLEKETGFSRSTFYRHFIDKDDLIQYVYDIKILPYGEGEVYPRDPQEADAGSSQPIQYAEYGELIWQLGQMRKYSRFMKMALTLDGVNSLRNHMTVEKYRRELWWYSTIVKGEFTEEMKESVDYHAAACVYVMAKWVLDDMPISEAEIADKIIKNRTVPQTDILGISAGDFI